MIESYIHNISNKAGKRIAEMHIYTHIGKDGVNASDFAKELNSLDVERLNVRINSAGGSVVDGFGIFSAMLNFKEKGGELHTYNDGLAASTGGWLLLAAEPKNIHSKDYAILMLHGVQNDVKGGLFGKAIENIFKGRTGLNVSELMTNGYDNFYDALEAANMGFYPSENIENTGLKIDIPENYNLLEIANKLQNIDTNINFKPLLMKTVINLLQLQEGASEAVIAAAVKNALDNVKTSSDALLLATNKATTDEATILELKSKVDVAVQNSAKTFVESQIKDGKFAPKDEDAKTALIANYVANPEGFKSMVSMMPTKAANVLETLEASEGDTKTILEKIANRSLREIERQDPSFLAQIKNEAMPEFVKLWNKQYNTEKKVEDFA
jgi:ATP-dependent protease ClpP protease subunit